MCFNAFFFVVLNYPQALNSGPHIPGILFPGNMSITVVLPLTLAGRIVNAPEARQVNTYPLLSIAWETLHVAIESIITQCYQAVKKFSETEHSQTGLSVKSIFYHYISCTQGRRVAGFYPSCQATTCTRTHTGSQFRVADLLDRTHADGPRRENVQTPPRKTPDPGGYSTHILCCRIEKSKLRHTLQQIRIKAHSWITAVCYCNCWGRNVHDDECCT